ncbi:MAG: hypothetical protein PVF83_05215 [Anaerolineales bacterium]
MLRPYLVNRRVVRRGVKKQPRLNLLKLFFRLITHLRFRPDRYIRKLVRSMVSIIRVKNKIPMPLGHEYPLTRFHPEFTGLTRPINLILAANGACRLPY